MKNQEIAAIFYEMADILEMQHVQWKPRAYRQAAQSIDSLKQDIAEIYRKGGLKAIESIPWIGRNLANKIVEYIKTGKMSSYEKLRKQVPKRILNLMEIRGLGPKRIEKLGKVLKISTVKELEKAAKAHKIAKIPTFGEKSEQDILEAIGLMKSSKGKIPLAQAEKTAKMIISKLKKLKEVKQIMAAGSIRRKKPFVRDLDILASSNKPEKVIDAFTNLSDVKKVMAKGSTKASVALKSGINADLRVFKPESWGAGLFYFTGNKNYNIEMRRIAIKKGCKLNEYGLFDKKSGKMIAGKTEKEIMKALGVKYINPEDREV